MAPSTTSSNSQQLLAQAAQKLSEAVKETGSTPNQFAAGLLELLEVSAKIQQFDDVAALARNDTDSEEVKKWQEISLLTMQHCRTHLEDQQRRAIESLCKLAEEGASISTTSLGAIVAAAPTPTLAPPMEAVKPPPGLAPQAHMGTPSSIPAPPGLGAPPGLRPPPGLASAGTAPPPGFGVAPKKTAATKKPAAAPPAAPRPWAAKKAAATKKPAAASPMQQNAGYPINQTWEAPSVLNLGAYDSDSD